ncbi:hypothetical protein FQV28_01205 [Planomicrobium sp. CPCC 101079]|nr:hypothetical protein FQV28_01205 [Planomicrobium sp. CPCC 101079]
MQHEDLKQAEASFLGEGAWHHAWKINTGEQVLVLRIPKEIAYGKTVEFDKAALNAEYRGTALYYQTVNQAVRGAAPEYFRFYVSEELSYTLEAFAGERLNIHGLIDEEAFKIGENIGRIYRETEEVPHGLNGFGYLYWSEQDGLKGSLEGNPYDNLLEENEEQLADYQFLCQANPVIKEEKMSKAITEACDIRKRAFTKVSLSNQDASPENLVLSEGQVRIIDPYPIVYYARGMAGNFMNLYETLFALLADTERYGKLGYDKCAEILRWMAKGFLAGYSAGNEQVAREVRAEQLLQLLESAFSHQKMLDGELTKSMRIRYGNKEAIKKRLVLLCDELKKKSAEFLEKTSTRSV